MHDRYSRTAFKFSHRHSRMYKGFQSNGAVVELLGENVTVVSFFPPFILCVVFYFEIDLTIRFLNTHYSDFDLFKIK